MHLLFVLVIVALMGCQQSMPTRKVYLPADCPTPEALISPAAHHHKKPTTKPATKPTTKATTTRQQGHNQDHCKTHNDAPTTATAIG